jgi:hypothetical protein
MNDSTTPTDSPTLSVGIALNLPGGETVVLSHSAAIELLTSLSTLLGYQSLDIDGESPR